VVVAHERPIFVAIDREQQQKVQPGVRLRRRRHLAAICHRSSPVIVARVGEGTRARLAAGGKPFEISATRCSVSMLGMRRQPRIDNRLKSD
jgi:hypothetical protein